MAVVESRVASGWDRFWRHQDFPHLPAGAVSQALSRLKRRGFLTRVRRGLYYRPRPTVLGPSQPSTTAVVRQALKHPPHPAGATAANLLGLSTQNPAIAHYATTATNAPRHFDGLRLHVRRPRSRQGLTEIEGAVLETLRERASSSELDSDATKEHVLSVIRQGDLFSRLAEAALEEPPRVRAMLGAIGQELGVDASLLEPLRKSLNKLSRFDFGMLQSLLHAGEWQAR